MNVIHNFDARVRHFVYTTLAERACPPTTVEAAEHLGAEIAQIEGAFERLAAGHQIALAPGTYSIWMAHPFSGIPTNFVAVAGGKKYWGN